MRNAHTVMWHHYPYLPTWAKVRVPLSRPFPEKYTVLYEYVGMYGTVSTYGRKILQILL